MLRSRTLAGLALFGVVAGSVAGCGGGDTGRAGSEGNLQDYCSSFRDAKKDFETLQASEPPSIDLVAALGRLQDLADQAPPAVADSWAEVDRGLNDMGRALDKAGLGFDELTDPGTLNDLSPRRARELGEQAQRLGGQQFDKARRAIEKHARKRCNIRFGQN